MLTLLFLAACGGPGALVRGQSGLADVQHTMGEPAMKWQDADGRTHLVYPRGPEGFRTWMVSLDPAGRVERVENLLDEAHFATIRPGMTEEQVTRALGPPQPAWTAYYPARDELAWEWRYCDWHAATRFDVLFDAPGRTVRSTLRVREDCFDGPCFCN
ncbi:MAG TPA: hypothetical protein VF801_04945 [Rhodocyclaceae bacterium]